MLQPRCPSQLSGHQRPPCPGPLLCTQLHPSPVRRTHLRHGGPAHRVSGPLLIGGQQPPQWLSVADPRVSQAPLLRASGAASMEAALVRALGDLCDFASPWPTPPPASPSVTCGWD